jgi:hypothetical protein
MSSLSYSEQSLINSLSERVRTIEARLDEDDKRMTDIEARLQRRGVAPTPKEQQ